jgi:D-glycero-D-manno-heptose 1,7-bisphosphate phosphatase
MTDSLKRSNELKGYDRFVLLDRDGVINQDSDDFVKSPEEWQPISGSLEAIAMLNAYGYQVAVISNQSGLARGRTRYSIIDHLVYR